MKKKLISITTAHFVSTFKAEPLYTVLSPGRINIIGEHVDYNHGFVLPAAINKYICFAISENEGTQCTIVAMDLSDSITFDITDVLAPGPQMWANYLLGVLDQFKQKGLPPKGFNLVFSSNIPMGAGLSSSAALECGFGFALNTMHDLGISKRDIALTGQHAEHNFVGVNCGIMDQFATVFGKKGEVIQLDCDTLEYECHKADFSNYSLLLLNSNVKHTHLTSGYNDRRREVEAGLSILKQHYPEISTFRDCTEQKVLAIRHVLGEKLFRRCHFVVSEIQRVLDAVAALDRADIPELGRLMYQTHDGLSTEYEVSCPELDFLVAEARKEPEVLGARLMGGGFGGCSINLVRKGSADHVINRLGEAYRHAFGIQLEAYKVKTSNGTSLVTK